MELKIVKVKKMTTREHLSSIVCENFHFLQYSSSFLFLAPASSIHLFLSDISGGPVPETFGLITLNDEAALFSKAVVLLLTGKDRTKTNSIRGIRTNMIQAIIQLSIFVV